MTKLKHTLLLSILTISSAITSTFSFGQCGPLSTPTVTNNGQSGIMFDVVALTSVNITQLAMDFDNGTYNIEIYAKAGTHVGFQANAGAWTLLGTANNWVATGGTNVPIPIIFSTFLCAGDVGAFYVTANNSTSGNYSNGTGVGNVAAADANIQILQGTGKAYPFGASYQPRVPNVTVFYDCAISCCLPPTMAMTLETCAGACDGTATATVGAGGVPPYSFQWDAAAGNQTTQTATGLCAGTYSVDVTDGSGCVSSGTITVTSGGASANATITPVGPFCPLDPQLNLVGADPGGTWSGTGITNAVLGTFDPGVAGVGTHTITYTIAPPCGDIQTYDIVVNANFNATITPVGAVCELDAPFLMTAVDGGGTWSGTGITNAATGEFSPTVAGTGTFTITYDIPGTCGDLQTYDITIDPALNATITQVGPFCAIEPPLTLSAVDPGGTWSGTGITNTATGDFDPSIAGIGTHTITYSIPGACGDLQTIDIVINAILLATINPVVGTCELDAPIILTAFDGGGTWSGTGITNAATGEFSPTVSGAGTFTITYTIAGACGDTQTYDITVDPALNATITQVGPFCEIDPVITLSAVDPGGTWSGNGIINAATGDFDPAAAGNGTHTITYTIPGACGDLQTIDIVINNLLDATITPVVGTCELDAPFLFSAVDGGGTWSGTGITNAATGEFDPSVAGSGTFTITYTIAGACGDVQTYDITVDPALNATITQVGPYCNIDPMVLLTAVDAGGTWSGTGITNAATGEFDPSVAGNGTHTITYTILGACGDVQSIDIVVQSSSNATITAAGPFCLVNPAVVLTAVDAGGTWSGNGITNAATGDFDPSVAGAGTHTITYTISGSCGDIQTTDIVVNSMDDATITPAGPLCLGTTINLTAVTGGGTWTGAGITSGVNGTFDPAVAGTGIHTITYTTNGPCPDVATTDIEVYPPLTVQAAGGTTICDGTAVTLTASGSGGSGNITFIWTDQNGNVVGSGTSITVTPGTNTTYTVTIADDCATPVQMANEIVIVNPIPTVGFVADNLLGCAPLDVTFTNTSFPSGSNCSWNFGNGITSTTCGISGTQYTNPGCYDITLTVTENGCTNSLTLDDYVCVADQPVADFMFSPDEATIFDTEFQFSNMSTYSDTYQWDFGDGSTSTLENPNYFYEQEPGGHTVCLVSSNAYGCSDTICKPVTIVEDVIFYIPNSFTPDGDEFNQTFRPIFTTGIDKFDFNFMIFNRWGEVIWESNDPDVGWDGSYNGANDLVMSGTYVWRVEFKVKKNDERRIHSGHVNILR